MTLNWRVILQIAFVVLLILHVSGRIQTTSTPNLPESEITALHELYNATQGWNWDWRPILPRWKFTPAANPCTGRWQGLTCTLPAPHTVYYVSEIKLGKYRLDGPLPASVGNFSHLVHMEVSENHITGRIPITVGRLSSLDFFSVGFNSLTGGLPDAVCELSLLKNLYVERNPLGGTIPPCLGALTMLRNLTILHNDMVGTIPAELGNLTELSVLGLSKNALTGTIPCSFAKLVKLQGLLLLDNQLTGTIPTCMSQMASLEFFYMTNNLLNGTLPASLGNLTLLRNLYVDINRLTGTIPASYSSLSRLAQFSVITNALTGTIPAYFGGFGSLAELGFSNNSFSGTIPAALGQATSLQSLSLYSNKLTGTLPPGLRACTDLTSLDFHENEITGSIPDFFDSLSHLSALYLNENTFTGSIPSSIGSLSGATEVELEGNFLTGSLPDSIGNLREVVSFYMGENFLTGTLPASLVNLTTCQILFLGRNLLRGTVPDGMEALQELTELALANNLLSGSIPSAFGQLRGLSTLLLGYNQFSGSLEGVFNASAQLQLASVQVNNNQLTGALPAEVFQLPALQTFVALSNCFHGSIPEAACNASSLSTLVLDGLSSSTSCRRELPSGAYLLSRSVGGTLPQCLFQLPSLVTLHLSGNVFTGPVPEAALPLMANLSDLSVSHNQLTGTIPAAFQTRTWYNLDLSYNRLSGSLSSAFGSVGVIPNQSAVSLENNRLSGRIPGFLQQMQNVSVLGTNLFECNLAGSDLPQHDSDRDNYQCGSSSFNVPFYLWLGLAALTVVLPLWGWGFKRAPKQHRTVAALITTWYESSQRKVDEKTVLSNLLSALEQLCGVAAYCAVYVTVVLLPCYLLLSHYYGTLTHSYAWTVSAAFLSGAVPVAVELPLLLLLLIVVLCAMHRAVSETTIPTPPATPTVTSGTEAIRNRAVICALFVIIDLVVVVGVNMLYVYIAIYQSSALLVLAQVLMSFFKLLWSSNCMDAMLHWLVAKLAPELLTDVSYAKAYRAQFLSLQLGVSLLNSIAIPCLVVAGISPNCFYNVFQAASVVRAQYIVEDCSEQLVGGVCFQYTPLEYFTEYDAPYTYNYQCSSSLITYYAPAYINLCIAAAFASPLASVLGVFGLKHAHSSTAIYRAVRYFTPRIVAPPEMTKDGADTILNANQLLVTLVTYLGVLLTFGTMLPPLGVALAATVAMVVLFTKLKIGRFLCSAEEHGQLDKFVRILEQQCEGAGSASFLQSALWMLVTLSCLFYALFLFDTLGDAVEFRRAMWVLIVVPLLPLCLYFLPLVIAHGSRFSCSNGSQRKGVGTRADIELGAVRESGQGAGASVQEGETLNALVLSSTSAE